MLYLVYVDGKYRAWTRGLSMDVRNLAPGRYRFEVVAKNDQGLRVGSATTMGGPR